MGNAVLQIQNDLFWIRIKLGIFRVPVPGKSSGSIRIRIQSIFFYVSLEIIFKKPLNSIIKKNLPTICHFLHTSTTFLQHTQSRIHRFKMKNIFFLHLSALSFFAGSGTIITYPDPGKSSGSMWIRIHNTGYNNNEGRITKQKKAKKQSCLTAPFCTALAPEEGQKAVLLSCTLLCGSGSGRRQKAALLSCTLLCGSGSGRRPKSRLA